MAEKRAWLTDPETGEKFHAWSHVKSIFYNKATNILLKDKLDEMDKLIDEKIKKAMMSNIQLNDQNKVPTSALAYNMQQLINKNADDITKLNSDKVGKGDTANLANIELSDGTPFIDFHFNNSQSDFTSRIIEESEGVLRVQANLLNPHSRSYFASDNTMDNGQGGRLGGIGYDGTDAYFIIDGSKHYVQLKN